MPISLPDGGKPFAVTLLRHVSVAVLLFATGCSEPPTAPGGLTLWPEPKRLPEIAFNDGKGQELTLASFRGRVILLNIWATWCAPCREEMPALDRLQQQLGGSDFEVVALSIDAQGPQIVRQFYDDFDIEQLRVYTDSSGASADELDARAVPMTLLIGRDGRELGRKLGVAVWDDAEVVSYLREVVDRGHD